jgi:hypothetical protein
MCRVYCLLMLHLFAVFPMEAAEPAPVRVFILAGQSNMEGKAKLSLLDYQAQQPGSRELFQLWQKDGKWIEREDVRIKFLDRFGKLTVGYGSPNCIGPEMEFGTVVGDHFAEPVLLIKTAWGGRSLYRDFRPPSAGLPGDDVLQKMLENEQKRNPNATLEEVKQKFGASYREMLAEVEKTLGDFEKYVPGESKRGYELAGFIWFQGWNDMIDANATAEYTTNLQHFIRDVRRDLKSPKLPFIIGQMGVDGANPNPNVVKFKAAQAAVLEAPEFNDNRVALVKTDVYWDTAAEAVFKKGWRENIDEWNKVGSDYPFHYLGSPRTMQGIGRGLAEAALKLQTPAR